MNFAENLTYAYLLSFSPTPPPYVFCEMNMPKRM